MQQEGGDKYVAEGTYGCVFEPPIKCRPESVTYEVSKDPAAVGKIFKSSSAFTKEREEAQRINKLDPKHVFTVPYKGACTVLRTAFNDAELNKCRLLQGSTMPYFSELIYKNGGYHLTSLYRPEKGKVAPKVVFDDLIKRSLPVLEGLATLLKKGFVHVDIKPDNMLYEPKSKKMYLIDFGMICTRQEVKTMYHLHVHRYPYYPPEFKTFYNMHAGTRDFGLTYDFVRQNFDCLIRHQFEAWLERRWPSGNYKGDLEAAIRSMLSKSLFEVVKDFDAIFAGVTDSYSVGISMVIIMYFLECTGALQVRSQKFVDSAMREVFFPMMHPNPYMRLHVHDAIKRLQALVAPVATPPPVSHPITIPATVFDRQPESPAKVDAVSIETCMQMKPKERHALLDQLGLSKNGTIAAKCARLAKATQKRAAAQILRDAIKVDNAAAAAAERAAADARAAVVAAEAAVTVKALGPSPTAVKRVYNKSLKDCNKSEDKGGYPIKELRTMARDLDLKHTKKRKEICDELQAIVQK